MRGFGGGRGFALIFETEEGDVRLAGDALEGFEEFEAR